MNKPSSLLPTKAPETMRSFLLVLAAVLAVGMASRATADTLRLTPEQIDRLGVRIERLEQGSAGATLARPATVAFDLDRIARMGPRISAKVISVNKDLGASVKKGDVLAVLSSVELGLAETRYRAAKARLETETRNYARERGLYEKKISSEASMLEARARYEEAEANLDAARDTLRLYGLSDNEIEHLHEGNRHSLSHLHLTSPIAGVVNRRDLAPGDTVGPNDTPIHVVDASRLWIMIDAFEQDVPYLAPGQEIVLTVRSLPGRSFRGNINWVSQELDPETRTVQTRAVVDNPDWLLRAGMFGTARIHTSRTAETALAPVDAIQTLDGKKVVFVPGDEAGSFRAVPVVLGEESNGRVEILSGVRPSQEVVTKGAFSLMSTLTADRRSDDD